MKKLSIVFGLLYCLINASYGQDKNGQFDPAYHFYPSGDPTGLYYFDGYYYNNWGVAKSKDFVHWKFTDYGRRRTENRRLLWDASTPAKVKDSIRQSMTQLGGSGTIVYDKDNTSGLGTPENPPFISLWHNQVEPWNTQVIGLAYSLDSVRSWKRLDKFPVLDIGSREFRDPKVFWYPPTQKWIMAIGWADVPKIKFFESDNLIDWDFLSDFGPWGAKAGVWECVDLFELPVDGDPNDTRWVLTISVQPLSGQYFIGHFDGKRFVLDEGFREDLMAFDNDVRGEVLFDFENGLDGWNMEGDAFLESPSDRALFQQGAIMGQQGKLFLNSFHNKASSVGKVTSPTFEIEKEFMNFLIGGGYYPDEVSINLIVDGQIVRSQSGNNSGGLQWKSWNVSEFVGKQASIQAVDAKTDEAGYIYVDHIMQSDRAYQREREKSFWFDYGPDFFAARAWNNYGPNEDRIVWTGWMGSWRYVASEPLRGLQSIPRELKLKTFAEGIRLVQHPIEELKSLRKKQVKVSPNTIEGVWRPSKLQPSKNVYELEVEFNEIKSKKFGVKIGKGGDQETTIFYDVDSQELNVDRTQSGKVDFSGLFPMVSSGPMRKTEIVKLHIFVDRSSVEVFGNDGETVISTKIYPDANSTDIEFFTEGGTVHIKKLNRWDLDNIELHQQK